MARFPVRTEGVVALSLFSIVKYFVGFTNFFKFVLGVRIFVDVRMILSRKLAISLLYLFFGSLARHAKRFVIVLKLNAQFFSP